MIEYIRYSFKCGLKYSEILQLLHACLGVQISYRQLKRILKQCHLYRKKHFSDIMDVVAFIAELKCSAQHHGYRWFHLRAVQHGLVVTQETIRELLFILDEEGVKLRQRHRLSRRMYHTKGPNAIWHFDGYDKLKPYGICIHGCIDGFSRKVIWLHANRTNNDPYIIAGYYMTAVKEHDGCPERLRSDYGTENGIVKEIQTQLRLRGRDDYSGEKSFMYGKSTSNQRIESWWGQLRRHGMQFWIDLFKQFQDDGHFTGTFLDRSILQFCFMGVIQGELDNISDVWNQHRIRKGRTTTHLPCGKPLLMFTVPEMYGGVDMKKTFDEHLYNELRIVCAEKGNPCDATVFELSCILVDEYNWSPPSDIRSATDLYMLLRNKISSLL